MALNQVTLTGTIPGANVATLVEFTPSSWLQDAADDQTVPPSPAPVYCNSSGHFSIALDATDNTVSPSTWYWTVTISGVPNVAPVTWSFYLLYANGATQDLSDLVAITPPTPMSAYMPLPSGTPTAGQVPRATGSGETSAWATLVDLVGTDIQPSPGTRTAGATGLAADAGHVHGQPPFFAPTGLTGAVAASRYVGATTQGPPTSGTWAVGDWVVDQTAAIWICVGAGTPGSWNAAVGNDYNSAQQLASGETTLPRTGIGAGAPLISGQLALSYFTALKTEVCNNLCVQGEGTVAAGLTYAALGLYTVAANGSITLVASTADVHTTLLSATFTLYTVPMLSSYTKQAGQRYAFGILLVGTTMPNPAGQNGTTIMPTFAPRLTGAVTGQSTLPASVAAGSIASNNAANMYFGAVTP